jgi:catechol 2,3-dioxygenase-like lactoylglutathione lyase family enzyme
MELGAFSISLTVKDLSVSRAFYEKLGFKVTSGESEGYLIMINGTTIIGLFHGMFEKNILTFNPGLNNNTERVADFTDVRKLQAELKAQGVELTTEADPETTGPASITMLDPDANPILIDQFF